MDTYTVAAAGLPALGWVLHGSMLARRLATARRDPLTGLHTRAGWTARAERLIAKHPGALVLLVDLDDFKAINDTHGHAAGDAVLTATARRLSNWCGHHGIAARLGGDEFAAINTNLGAASLFDLWSALDRRSPTRATSCGSRRRSATARLTTCRSRPSPTLSRPLTRRCTRPRATAGATHAERLPERPRSPNFRRPGRLNPTSDPTDRKGKPMMPQPSTPRVCSHCDGFPVVHITTGSVTPDGNRRTLPATCPVCKGTGTRTASAVLVRAGK